MAERTQAIVILGATGPAVAELLRARLAEMTGEAECFAITCAEAPPDDDSALVFTPGRHDVPAFTVEKIIDALAGCGLVHLDAGVLSPEEEAQIRSRLQGLGYLE